MSEKHTTLSQLRAVSQKSKDRAAQVADAAAAALDEMDGVKADKTEFVSFSIPATGWKTDSSVPGYTNYIELQTFPAMGKEVFLYLKRRRWKIKQEQRQEQKSYTNSYSYNEKGMKATKAFGDFLKEIDWV